MTNRQPTGEEMQVENAIITLRSVQQVEGETEKSELNTTGSYCFSPDRVSISYLESGSDADDVCETTVLLIDRRLVSISRHGSFESDFLLEVGKYHPTRYQTPVGDLDLSVYAISIEQSLTPSGGRLFLKYSIDINGVFSSVNTVVLRVKVDVC